MLGMHLMGLRDDRRALGPYSKLIIQLGVTTALVASFKELRALTALGTVPSVVIVTVLWIAAITNAFNFLDNMDGLRRGSRRCASVGVPGHGAVDRAVVRGGGCWRC